MESLLASIYSTQHFFFSHFAESYVEVVVRVSARR